MESGDETYFVTSLKHTFLLVRQLPIYFIHQDEYSRTTALLKFYILALR